MILPDTAAVRKPRRLGLVIPWALAAAIAVGWSGGWFWLKAETIRKMDTARAQAAAAGWRLDWTNRKVSGFPFRLNVDLINAHWGEASGWSVTAPVLNAQAYVSRTDSWTMVAPRGVVVTRPMRGAVNVKARILRGSIANFDSHPPRVSIEGIDVRFDIPKAQTSNTGLSASELHLHTKAGPLDQGAFYVSLDHMRNGAGQPNDFIIEAVYTHASALNGRDWPSEAKAWEEAGGRIDFRQGDARSPLINWFEPLPPPSPNLRHQRPSVPVTHRAILPAGPARRPHALAEGVAGTSPAMTAGKNAGKGRAHLY